MKSAFKQLKAPKGGKGANAEEGTMVFDIEKSPKGSKSSKGSNGKEGESYYNYNEDKIMPLETIPLGNKRPEGIAAGPGDYLFVSEVLFGGVQRVNVLTGERKQIVPSFGLYRRGALGLAYYNGTLVVAGGGETDAPFSPPASLYVYDAETGTELAQCAPSEDEGFVFLNDVTMIDSYAYVTDWYINKIMVVDVEAALDGDCVVKYIETPAEYFLSTPDTFPRANGKILQILNHFTLLANISPILILS